MSGGFEDLGLLPELLRAVEEEGWFLPTDIQDEAIPLILGGGDVLGAAETGSGKTAAFALPIIQCVCEQLRHMEITKKSSDLSERTGENTAIIMRPLALVVEPTRDLAEQVFRSFCDLSRFCESPPIHTQKLIGDDFQKTRRGADIVVGTIGKLIGNLQSKTLDLSQVRFIVLDEADKLATVDNVEQIKTIFRHCPDVGTGCDRLQVCFFSATLHSKEIRALADLVCVNPTWIDLKGAETTLPSTIHHLVLPVDPETDFENTVGGAAKAGVVVDEVHVQEDLLDRKHLKSQRIKEMKPHLVKQLVDDFNMSQVLIFCRTNLDCTNLEKFFNFQNALPANKSVGFEAKYSCRTLGGKLRMEDRRAHLQMFKDGEIRMLISTDVAARGLDIAGLPFVIQATLPDNAEDYVHRIGRVGRADRMGLAVALVAARDQEKVWFHRCASRGVSCANRQLVSDKGCTIWYDEPALLRKIEEKIQSPVLRMSALRKEREKQRESGALQWRLPDEIAALQCVYGEAQRETQTQQGSVYMTEHMAKEVQQLARLETKAQLLFLRMNDVLSTT